MIKSILSAALLLTFCLSAQAEPAKTVQPVTCEGQAGAAHTLIVGNCSFTGEQAAKVDSECKEDQLCRVRAAGWNNGRGMFIVTSVSSVEKIDRLTPPLSTQELSMARACKAGKPCSLTCNRAHDAGRDDLIRAGACAE